LAYYFAVVVESFVLWFGIAPVQEELAEDRIAMQPYLYSWVLEQLVETLVVAEVAVVAVVVLCFAGQVEGGHSMSLPHLLLGVEVQVSCWTFQHSDLELLLHQVAAVHCCCWEEEVVFLLQEDEIHLLQGAVELQIRFFREERVVLQNLCSRQEEAVGYQILLPEEVVDLQTYQEEVDLRFVQVVVVVHFAVEDHLHMYCRNSSYTTQQ